MRPPDIILADWDEDIGPIIIKAIIADKPSEDGKIDTENDPEVLVSRCYIAAQSIFAKEQFSKINFNLPIVSSQKLAVVSFDIAHDESVRGSKRPFLLLALVPMNTRYAITDAILAGMEPFVLEYKDGKVPDLASIQEMVSERILKGEESANQAPFTKEQLKEELKEEFSGILKDHAERLASQGVKVKVFACPTCQNKIYPDEVACTKCKTLIRTFCTRCDSLVERTLRFCSKCGQRNPKFDPSIQLVLPDDAVEHDLIQELDLAPALKGSKVANLLDIDDGDGFDLESAKLHDEIKELKAQLEAEHRVSTKQNLFKHFTKDYEPLGDAREVPSEQPAVHKSIASIALQQSLGEAAVDEVDLIIKAMGSEIGRDESKGSKERDNILVNYWDCSVLLHAQSKVLIGLGTDPASARPIPGTLFITTSTVMFVSYQYRIEDVQTDLFAYLDLHPKYVQFHPAEAIQDNCLQFKPHGILGSKFPNWVSLTLNFSWSDEQEKGNWSNQAITLKSTLEKLKVFEREPPVLLGKYYFLIGKPPTDAAIRNIMGDLTLHYQAIASIIKAKYQIL